jgi:hypothetical protein
MKQFLNIIILSLIFLLLGALGFLWIKKESQLNYPIEILEYH